MTTHYTWYKSMGNNDQAKTHMENVEGRLHTAVGEITCNPRKGKETGLQPTEIDHV